MSHYLRSSGSKQFNSTRGDPGASSSSSLNGSNNSSSALGNTNADPINSANEDLYSNTALLEQLVYVETFMPDLNPENEDDLSSFVNNSFFFADSEEKPRNNNANDDNDFDNHTSQNANQNENGFNTFSNSAMNINDMFYGNSVNNPNQNNSIADMNSFKDSEPSSNGTWHNSVSLNNGNSSNNNNNNSEGSHISASAKRFLEKAGFTFKQISTLRSILQNNSTRIKTLTNNTYPNLNGFSSSHLISTGVSTNFTNEFSYPLATAASSITNNTMRINHPILSSSISHPIQYSSISPSIVNSISNTHNPTASLTASSNTATSPPYVIPSLKSYVSESSRDSNFNNNDNNDIERRSSVSSMSSSSFTNISNTKKKNRKKSVSNGSTSDNTNVNAAGISQDSDTEKRKRNTEASARFRIKKKMKEQKLENDLKELRTLKEELELKIKNLAMENRLLRNLVVEKNNQRTSEEVENMKLKALSSFRHDFT